MFLSWLNFQTISLLTFKGKTTETHLSVEISAVIIAEPQVTITHAWLRQWAIYVVNGPVLRSLRIAFRLLFVSFLELYFFFNPDKKKLFIETKFPLVIPYV